MFLRILSVASKTAFNLHRTATGIGAAIIITLSVYDFVQKRRERKKYGT